ncbi:MAG: S-layer homology domain-containing protein, partial [Oscillospiraceae bacterium]
VEIMLGSFTMTDTTIQVLNRGQHEWNPFGKAYTYALRLYADATVSIVSGTLKNAFTQGYTFKSSNGQTVTKPKTLASCIAPGSTADKSSTAETINEDTFQICKDTITVTKGGGGQPIPPDGILSSPLSQDEVNSAFGAGNATFVSPGTITINKDLVLDNSIRIDTSVTIDLNGKNVTVKDSTGDADGKPAFIVTDGATLTVTGSGSITGGKGSGTGTGGSAISGTGGGSVVISGGASVVGGSGGGTNGSGGDGVKTENGNITVGTGSVTGGSGSGGGTGGNGASSSGSGNIIINAGGSAIGGAGGTSDGTNAGGTGGAGTDTGATGGTTADGAITGGNGGDGKGSGNGGTGGAGANENGTISGGGTITGGNGGNIPENGSGTPGSGGDAITGGGNAGSTTTKPGGKGVKATAKVDSKPGAPTVSVPEQQLVDAAVSDTDRTDADITGIQVTLTVERKDDKPNAGAVEGAKPEGSTVGLYLDITLEKKVTKTGGTTDTTMVTNAEKPIAITLDVPEDMWGGSGYALMCVHKGKAENLGGIYNEASHTLTAQSDKFSTYAIAYTPKSVNPPPAGGDFTPPTYTPETPTVDHGSVTVSPKNPAKGDKVTVTVTPDPGYEAGQITVTDKDGKNVPVTRNADGSYSFIQPQGAVKIAATMRLAWNPFGDVKVGDWFHDSVKYVYESGLMAGMDAQTFAPNSGTSRAMIVTILWRMQGEPKAKAASDFVDVPAGAWFSEAVAWAQEQKLAAGVDEKHFEPNRDISRQELASLFYRYAVLAKLAPTGAWQVPLTYADKSKIADWAVEGAMFAQLKGFIKGRPGNIFAPNAPATRAEASSMLQRFITAK